MMENFVFFNLSIMSSFSPETILANILPPTPSLDNGWFICLCAPHYRISIDSDAQEQDEMNNKQTCTMIYVTLYPYAMISAMNVFGRNTSLLGEPYRRRISKKRSMVSIGHYRRRSTRKNVKKWDLVCVVGPVATEEMANALMQQWESSSRGLQPRSICGLVLANLYNLPRTVDWYAFFKLREQEVYIFETKNKHLLFLRRYNGETDQNMLDLAGTYEKQLYSIIT